MIVETTNYFAIPGKAEEVLEHRRRGVLLREELGLAPGKIYVKVSGDGPDVRWECTYPSMAAFERDMATRALSAEFAIQRREMGKLTERFERHVQMLVEE